MDRKNYLSKQGYSKSILKCVKALLKRRQLIIKTYGFILIFNIESNCIHFTNYSIFSKNLLSRK